MDDFPEIIDMSVLMREIQVLRIQDALRDRYVPEFLLQPYNFTHTLHGFECIMRTNRSP